MVDSTTLTNLGISNSLLSPNIQVFQCGRINRRDRLSVSICTDNRLISNTTLSHELELVTRELGLKRRQLRNLVVAGFKGSFFHGHYNEKRTYIRQVTDRYAQLKKKLLPALR
ncbi:MAG: hypothetical protein O7B35_08425 [Deltaproteobacteria bacterium]|nr:hypothetical protein [Deltaproteobacteria bacterium]